MSLKDEPLPIPSLNLSGRRRSPWRRAALCLGALCALVTLLIAASYVLRSEWFLRSRIDPKLEQMGDKLHGDFSYESVEPIGLTGVRVRGLKFEPDADIEGQRPLAVEQLVVYPDLAAMLTGDLRPLKLELYGVDAELWLDGGPGGRGHWPWLEAVVESWSSRAPLEGSGGGGGNGDSSMPEVEIHGGRLSLLAPQGTLPHVGVSVDDLTVRKVSGQIQLDGAIHVDGLGYAMLSGDANRASRQAGVVVELSDRPNLLDVAPDRDRIRELVGENSRLELGGVAVQWPPALILHDIRLTDTRIGVPGHEAAWVEEVGARQITTRLFGQQLSVSVDDFAASVRLQWWGDLGTSVPVRLPRFEALADLEERRIGAGFELTSDNGGTLELESAVDIDERDVAVRLEADDYDAGRLLSFIPYTGPVEVSSGILDGHAALRYPLDTGLVDIDMFIEMSEMDLEAWWLSETPVKNANVTLDMRPRIDLEQGTLTVDDGMMSVGEMMMSLDASIQQTEGRDVILDVSLMGDNLQAEDILTSIPEGFAPALKGYQLSGDFDVELGVLLDTGNPESLELRHNFDVSNLHVNRFGPDADIPLLATDDFAVRVATAADDAMTGPGTSTWTRFDQVPGYFPEALIASEDGRFYRHAGFDPSAIESSLVANLAAGRIVRGGSTISQQVVKNLFLGQQKTLARKLQEAFLTWQLESLVPKERIIELYMNLAEWGYRVHGVRAAAEHYFQKEPAELKVRETLFLAAILPNPVRFGEQYARGFIREDRLDKMRRVLAVLHHRGLVDETNYRYHDRRVRQAAISRSPRPAPRGTSGPEPEPQSRLLVKRK